MRWSQTLIPTLKESPADAVAPSHIYLLRAGMIRQLGSGAYTYLPLGYRVLQKITAIVRREMDAAGASELHMPALQPVDLWRESGRYANFGETLMHFALNNQTEVALGPTHEEVITDLVRDLLKSYRQLPMTLYQIQTKFRDEPRPRFGILRTREFLMKDAYSFSANLEQLDQIYRTMYEAYCRVFEGSGIPYAVVEAESGPIGGDSSHEFMVPCETGEDILLRCPDSGYAANQEKAVIGAPAPRPEIAPDAPAYQEVATPGQKTIEQVATFLKVESSTLIKTLVFQADDKPVVALLRGDHEANEAKIRRAFSADTLEPAGPELVQKTLGGPIGFVGPVGLPASVPMAIDQAVSVMTEAVVGGNAEDLHLRGVVPGRDFPLDRVEDLRNAQGGDPSPVSGSAMIQSRGVEVGHIFKLGTKYSDAMQATFLDESGQAHSLIMGCYGIGVNRIMAAAVEALHDKNGIVWPLPIAPYTALLVPLQVDNVEVMGLCDQFAEELEGRGIDVLIDDRNQRPGVKFKDADLIGIPLRIVLGERGLKEGLVEVKWRTESDAFTVPVAEAVSAVAEAIEQANRELQRQLEESRDRRAANPPL